MLRLRLLLRLWLLLLLKSCRLLQETLKFRRHAHFLLSQLLLQCWLLLLRWLLLLAFVRSGQVDGSYDCATRLRREWEMREGTERRNLEGLMQWMKRVKWMQWIN